MNRTRTLSIGLSLLLLTGLGTTAKAKSVSPELQDVLDNCIAQLRQVANLAKDQIDTNARCGEAVKKLLEDGEKETAIRKARDCFKESRKTNREMRMMCRRCIKALREVGAPRQIIHRYLGVCHRQIRRVKHSEKPLLRLLHHARNQVRRDQARRPGHDADKPTKRPPKRPTKRPKPARDGGGRPTGPERG